MPPCRTTLEMRAGSMPDSRATMTSASSEAWRCWASKSAGTYSASITGVIGSTLRRRTVPCQVCDSVAAVAIAGLARSVSARSIGTRMELNISASLSAIRLKRDSPRYYRALACCFEHDPFGKPVPTFPDHALTRISLPASVARRLLQQFWADKEHQPSVAERHVVPVVGCKLKYRKP